MKPCFAEALNLARLFLCPVCLKLSYRAAARFAMKRCRRAPVLSTYWAKGSNGIARLCARLSFCHHCSSCHFIFHYPNVTQYTIVVAIFPFSASSSLPKAHEAACSAELAQAFDCMHMGSSSSTRAFARLGSGALKQPSPAPARCAILFSTNSWDSFILCAFKLFSFFFWRVFGLWMFHGRGLELTRGLQVWATCKAHQSFLGSSRLSSNASA